MSDVRIGTRLTIGFGIILAIMTVLDLKAMSDVSITARSTENLYQHPFTVTKQLGDARFAVFALYVALREGTADSPSAVLNTAGVFAALAQDSQTTAFVFLPR